TFTPAYRSATSSQGTTRVTVREPSGGRVVLSQQPPGRGTKASSCRGAGFSGGDSCRSMLFTTSSPQTAAASTTTTASTEPQCTAGAVAQPIGEAPN